MKKATILILFIALAVAVLVLFVVKNKKQKSAYQAALDAADAVPPIPGAQPKTIEAVKKQVLASDVFPLKKGSRGNYVEVLQLIINYYITIGVVTGIEPLTADGIFGNKTEAALRKLNGQATISKEQLLKLLQTANLHEGLLKKYAST